MDVGIWETIKKQKRVKQYGVWTLEYEGEKEEKKKKKGCTVRLTEVGM